MRKLILGTFALSLLLGGCKAFQKSQKHETYNTPAQAEEQPAAKVFSAPAPTQSSTKTATPTSPKTTYNDKQVRTQTEDFSFTQQDDASKYQNSTYFVIIGSFSSPENASRYKKQLAGQGFSPIILHSETGYYRVCVDSYADEYIARQKVKEIRTDYPKHADTWLLIKKK